MSTEPENALLSPPAATAPPPRVRLFALDTLWFQVGGTVCNLACTHCFVSCSPTNHTHEMLSLAAVRPFLEEGAALGVKEYYFTGGEPFLNPEMEAILAAALEYGPASVLTNGLLLDDARCARLRALAEATSHSLELRISLDGFTAASHDAIRGPGAFERALAGLEACYRAGLQPVVTVTEVHAENGSPEGRQQFFELLRRRGSDRPRLKILPVFQIGAEAARSRAYQSWQQLQGDESEAGWDHLQCSSCRMVTDLGVWVCPILVNEPAGRMGATLADSLEAFPLAHPACWTCHVYGVSCKT